MTKYSRDVLLFLFGTSLLFHVQFKLLLPDLHTDFSRGRSGGLVSPSLSEFSEFIATHTVKGFGTVDKAEIDVFLELSCFFDDPVDVGNLVSSSSAFVKTSLSLWKFTVHILLQPGLENFEHYFTSTWDECNCAVVWAFFGIGMKTDLFQSCGHCWVFQICWYTEYSTFTALSFRIWKSSTGIPSPPLALFIMMLPKAHLTSHSRMCGSRWVITPSWLSGLWRFFLYNLCILDTS